MAAVLENEVAICAGAQRNPFLLAVLGGVHVFRALEQLRQAASQAATRGQPLNVTDLLQKFPWDHHEEGRDRDVMSQCPHLPAKPSAPHAAPSVFHPKPFTRSYSHDSAKALSGIESWQSHQPESSAQGQLGTTQELAEADPLQDRQQIRQDLQDQTLFGWEELAALHVAALAQATATWVPQPPAATPTQPGHHHHHHHLVAPQQSGTTVAGVQGERSAERTGAELEPHPSWLQGATICAGAASRTLAQAAIHPLDTLKTRMQVNLATPQLRMWRAVMSCPAARARALLAWAGPAGLRDLFLGLGAALMGTLPASALYFATEQGVRGWLAQAAAVDRESAPCRLAASAAAASLSALIRVPADVIKHRVQAYAYPSSSHAARNILGSRGPAGLYSGFGATLLRDAPEIVVQFTVYSQLKALLERHQRRAADGDCGAPASPSPSPSAASAAEHMVLGGAAGAAAALLTTPLDVVKTQLQCGAAPSVSAAVAGALRAGGPAALFGGLAPRLLQTTLCSAIFFTCFEASKTHLAHLASSASASASGKALMPTPDMSMAALAAAAAAAVRLPPLTARQPSPPPSPPPPPLQQQERGSPKTHRWCSRGGRAPAAGVAADGPQLLWEAAHLDRRPLVPVAVYAYAYAGAATPRAV